MQRFAVERERCKKSGIRYKVVYRDKNGIAHTTFTCLKCLHLYKFEDQRFGVDPKTHLMVHDEIGTELSKEAVLFIEKKLSAFDFVGRATIFITIKNHDVSFADVMVKHRFPAKPKNIGGAPWVPWLEARVQVYGKMMYPHTKKMNVRSVQVKDEAAKILMGGVKWFYETEDVTFGDSVELMVFGAGYGAFKILRTLKLVPGLASKIGMTNAGLEWMREFRQQRTQTKPKTKPSSRPEMTYAKA